MYKCRRLPCDTIDEVVPRDELDVKVSVLRGHVHVRSVEYEVHVHVLAKTVKAYAEREPQVEHLLLGLTGDIHELLILDHLRLVAFLFENHIDSFSFFGAYFPAMWR